MTTSVAPHVSSAGSTPAQSALPSDIRNHEASSSAPATRITQVDMVEKHALVDLRTQAADQALLVQTERSLRMERTISFAPGLCVRCKRAAEASGNLLNRVAHLRVRESPGLQAPDQLRLRKGLRFEGFLRRLNGLRVPVRPYAADGVRRFGL